MKRITVDQIMALNPCHYYPRTKVTDLLGGESCDLARFETAIRSIHAADMRWIVVRLLTDASRSVWTRNAAARTAEAYAVYAQAHSENASPTTSGADGAAFIAARAAAANAALVAALAGEDAADAGKAAYDAEIDAQISDAITLLKTEGYA